MSGRGTDVRAWRERLVVGSADGAIVVSGALKCVLPVERSFEVV